MPKASFETNSDLTIICESVNSGGLDSLPCSSRDGNIFNTTTY